MVGDTGRRVGVVFGGRSAEHRVSIRSARTVAGALAEAGFEVSPLGIALDGCWVEPAVAQAALDGETDTLEAQAREAQTGGTQTGGTRRGELRASLEHLLAAPIDIAFPLVHGTWGEDGTMQGLFEMLDLPYVGAGVAASAIAMDKVQCKRLLESNGIRTVEFVAFDRRQWGSDPQDWLARARALRESTPGSALFVKPSVGGSSVGIRRVNADDELEAAIDFAFRFDDLALIERAVTGRELECAVRRHADRTRLNEGIGEWISGL